MIHSVTVGKVLLGERIHVGGIVSNRVQKLDQNKEVKCFGGDTKRHVIYLISTGEPWKIVKHNLDMMMFEDDDSHQCDEIGTGGRRL